MNALFSRLTGSLTLAVVILVMGNLSVQATDYYNDIGGITVPKGQTDNNYAVINRGYVDGGTLNNRAEGTVNELSLLSTGSTVNNYGKVGTASIFGGRFTNTATGTVSSGVSVYGGNLTNAGSIYSLWMNDIYGAITASNSGTISIVSIYGGTLTSNGTIGRATVNGGTLIGNGTVGSVTVNNGSFTTSEGVNIQNLTMYGGEVTNTSSMYRQSPWSRSTINGEIVNANVMGGTLNNTGGFSSGVEQTTDRWGDIGNLTLGGDGVVNNRGDIRDATVNGGVLNNLKGNATNPGSPNPSGIYSGNIKNLTLNSGTVDNGGGITKMTYTNGTYNAGTGTLATLNLAGNSANNAGDWGKVTNLEFADNGSGILTVSAFADDTTPGYYSGVRATNANFNYGNVSLDLSGIDGMFGDIYWADTFFDAFGGTTGFLLGDLVGAGSRVNGVAGLQSLEMVWGDYAFWILNDGVLADGWSIANQNGFVSWNGMTYGGVIFNGGDVSTPEPATLAIIGLGLAGLGLARRRMKK